VAALGLEAGHPAVRGYVELGLLADDPQRLRATTKGRRVLDRLTTELATAPPLPPHEVGGERVG
jgi:hypothetical protein